MKTYTLTEERALVVLGTAAGKFACPIHTIGPVASHLVGPAAATRPDWHPNRTPNLHHASYVDRLVDEASGGRPLRCSCGPFETNGNLRVVPGGSLAALAYPLPNDPATQTEVAALIAAADLDAALPMLDPRLDALKTLADYARAEGGGRLDHDAREAVEVLGRSLAGRTRWDVIDGWGQGHISGRAERRHGLVSEQIEMLLSDEGVGMRIMQRLLEGD